MESIQEQIKALSTRYLGDIIETRRHLHQHPELSTREEKTAGYIAGKLKEYGIPYHEKVGGFGVVGLIHCDNPGDFTVALRADMDALPIDEKNDVPYCSVNKGVMHACGHDVHMASLLGAARILNELKGQLKGTVKLIFQPSEERYPGGAISMIRDGVLDNPRPDLIIGQHVYPELDAGKAGMREGFYMASTDEIYITVKGKGGHGAIPHKVTDPVLIASFIVTALQQLVSRNADPAKPTVLSIGRFIADGRTNIIPDEARLEGIIRTFDEEWREVLKEKINKLATSIAEGMGAVCEVFIDPGYPALYNDPVVTGKVKADALEYLGQKNVEELEMRMTAEDFAYFAREVPACFYRLGVRNTEKGIVSNLHSSAFDVDESSLETGMGLMAWLAASNLMSYK